AGVDMGIMLAVAGRAPLAPTGADVRRLCAAARAMPALPVPVQDLFSQTGQGQGLDVQELIGGIECLGHQGRLNVQAAADGYGTQRLAAPAADAECRLMWKQPAGQFALQKFRAVG